MNLLTNSSLFFNLDLGKHLFEQNFYFNFQFKPGKTFVLSKIEIFDNVLFQKTAKLHCTMPGFRQRSNAKSSQLM